MKKVIQIILLLFAVGSFYMCYDIGLRNKVGYTRNDAAPITSGLNGGALGMGVICAASLLGIALIEKDN